MYLSGWIHVHAHMHVYVCKNCVCATFSYIQIVLPQSIIKSLKGVHLGLASSQIKTYKVKKFKFPYDQCKSNSYYKVFNRIS